jgi:poly(rC)-binding protein 2/3/4
MIRYWSGMKLTGRIGKGGAKIKEIQEASGARLNASESMLPGSTEVSSLATMSHAVS